MRISITRIAPRGGFSFAILAQTGLEPVRTNVQWCLRPSPMPIRILSHLAVLVFNVWWNILPTFRQKGATNYLLVANNIWVKTNM